MSALTSREVLLAWARSLKWLVSCTAASIAALLRASLNYKRFDDGSDIARLAAAEIKLRMDLSPYHVHRIFTTEACPSGYVVAKAVAYTPNPYAKPYRPNVRERPYAPLGGVAQGSTITVQRNESACEAARRWRDVVLGSNNQGGNVDVRRQLNDAVARECY